MKLRIALLSDSTGETADQLLSAALAQFSSVEPAVERYRHIGDARQAEKIVEDFSARGGHLIISTLAQNAMRRAVIDSARKHRIRHAAVMEPLVSAIEALTGAQPLQTPGRNHAVNDAYFRKIEAIEFALRCDDGQSPELWPQADLVLLGVSRSGKTPVSIRLALKGFAVANVPILSGVAMNPQIWKTDPARRIGLLISPGQLVAIRKKHIACMGLAPETTLYAQKETVLRELNTARKVMSDLGCRIYETTDRSCEELAGSILEDLKLL